MSLAVIILAGGESKRMGFAKLLLEYQNATLLTRTIHKAKQLSHKVTVVVGKYAEIYSAEAKKSEVEVVNNPDWDEGLASSLRAGVASLSREIQLALILLPDQPFVSVGHLEDLLKKQQQTRAHLVFSSYDGVLGAPTLIHHTLFQDVQTLRGNVGARTLINERVKVAEVELEDSLDIDTPEDAEHLKRAE